MSHTVEIVDRARLGAQSDASLVITGTEALAVILVAALALFSANTLLFERFGWPFLPAFQLTLLAIQLLFAAWALRVAGSPRIEWNRWEVAALALVVFGVFAFLLWLVWPSFLPLTDLEDSVTHVMLAQWLIDFHHLPDESLSAWLGGLADYPPAFHAAVACAAELLGVPAMRALHPVLSLFVALKAGFVFLITARLVGPVHGILAGLVATASLALPYTYSLESFTRWSFFPQVAAETFVLALLWATVRLVAGPAVPLAVFAALCGMALLRTWTGYPFVAFVTLGVALLLTRRSPPPRRLLAIVGVAGAMLVMGLGDLQSLLKHAIVVKREGGVAEPSVAALSVPLLVAGGWGGGVALAARGHAWMAQRAWVVVLFALVAATQMAILYGLNLHHGVQSFYAAYKMVHILIYPLAILSGVGVGALANWAQQRGLTPGGASPVLGLVLAAAILLLSLQQGLLSGSGSSGMTEELTQVGLWSAQHLPGACVEYIVPDRVGRFWLHVGLLGNAWWIKERRTSVLAASDAYPRLPEWLARPNGYRYAIVSGWSEQPVAERGAVRILYRYADTVAIEHPSSEAVACPPMSHPPRPRPAPQG